MNVGTYDKYQALVQSNVEDWKEMCKVTEALVDEYVSTPDFIQNALEWGKKFLLNMQRPMEEKLPLKKN
ncbi:MAG: hypothetical protein HWD61_12400 [Parachlamydiaceae bacterium]|nr:MAG: hypothetical protein HWD61_12400 [Parachlamydiaceae bacterium]